MTDTTIRGTRIYHCAGLSIKLNGKEFGFSYAEVTKTVEYPDAHLKQPD